MKIIKLILKILGGVFAFFVGVSILILTWDEIEFQYTKLFWEPNATFLGGVSIGESRSDVIFKKGTPDMIGNLSELYTDSGVTLTYSENGFVKTIYKNQRLYDLPFDTVEKMKEILGEEDILAISGNFETRRYTYLEWGVTYSFTQNDLTLYQIGDVQWRNFNGGGEVGEYIVKGRVVCPSDDCPWDSDAHIKTEYLDKDYTMFLPD